MTHLVPQRGCRDRGCRALQTCLKRNMSHGHTGGHMPSSTSPKLPFTAASGPFLQQVQGTWDQVASIGFRPAIGWGGPHPLPLSHLLSSSHLAVPYTPAVPQAITGSLLHPPGGDQTWASVVWSGQPYPLQPCSCHYSQGKTTCSCSQAPDTSRTVSRASGPSTSCGP